MPAIAAQRQRGIAAPVEEQQRLLAALQPRLDLLHQPWREPAAAFELFFAQVDHVDVWQARAAEPVGQFDALIGAVFGKLHRFERGSRAGKDHRDLFEPRPDHRDVARVVAHAILLLEGILVSLVHHEQP